MSDTERAKWLSFIRRWFPEAKVTYIGRWRGRSPGERELTSEECDESRDVAFPELKVVNVR
jgi:hypothetical protein